MRLPIVQEIAGGRVVQVLRGCSVEQVTQVRAPGIAASRSALIG
jgi:hypothetical protein